MTNLRDLIARLRYEDAAPSGLWALDAAEVMRLAADTIEALAGEGGSEQERARRRYLKDKLAEAIAERDRYRAAVDQIGRWHGRGVPARGITFPREHVVKKWGPLIPNRENGSER